MARPTMAASNGLAYRPRIADAGLLRFRQQIDTRRTGEPAFLAVVCGSGYGYRRADGIAVVPVGALGT